MKGTIRRICASAHKRKREIGERPVTGSLGLLPSGPDPVRESHARRQPPDGRLLGPWPEGNPPNVHGVFLSHGR
jgi:hypothetical protein